MDDGAADASGAQEGRTAEGETSGDMDVGAVSNNRVRYNFSQRNRIWYSDKELRRQYIVSGTYRRVFVNARMMLMSTRTGPAACDVMTRTDRCAVKCNVQGTPDRVLSRDLLAPTDIVVEFVVNGAVKMFKEKCHDVCELFSPPRIVAEAGLRRFGGVQLKQGWSLNLTQVDPDDGKPWDFEDKAKVAKLWRLLKDGKPYCVICSPPCTMHCALQALNRTKTVRRRVGSED